MAIKQVKVNVNDLTIGMYVSQLDRPWTHTPFPLQGFQIRTTEDINTVRHYCDYVFIDITKGRSPLDHPVAPASGALGQGRAQTRYRPGTPSPGRGGPEASEPSRLVVRKGVYPTTVSLRAEIRHAQVVIRALQAQLIQVAKQIARGRLADYDQLKLSVDGMVESILRCPDAFTWLIRLRQHDQHAHEHSLRSALWAVQFARFIGMDRREISTLCLGTLLKDIGKIRVSATILRKRNRSPEEEAEYRKFVMHGVELLRDTRHVEPRVISVVRYHCERLDGSGFPEGLSGSKIPLLARIAGIATVFDAISNPLEAEQPVAPSKAVSLLYDMRGTLFQEDLVVQFIQSIGLYPAGTLVELTTGDIGVVVEQHPNSRLTPQVAVLDQNGDRNANFLLIDLKQQDSARELLAARGRTCGTADERIAIARDLEPTGYDIDVRAISALFMQAEEERRAGLLARLRERFRRTD
ncbi:MAG: HD-GYP domain-containing protein [Pseudomonadota bacterium]|jgi:HD-GYP domain-containing protein (c-di-GMP phosphodiesterase class II)